MPCRCDFEPSYYHRSDTQKVSELQERVDTLRKDCKNLQKLADEATQLLCYLCGVVRPIEATISEKLDPRLKEWLKKHDEFDEKRTLTELMKHHAHFSLSSLQEFTVKENARKGFIGKAEKIHPLSVYHRTEYFDKLWNMLIEKRKENTKKEEKLKEIAELKKRLTELENDVKNFD